MDDKDSEAAAKLDAENSKHDMEVKNLTRVSNFYTMELNTNVTKINV